MGENVQSTNMGFQRATDAVAAVGTGEGGWLDVARTARDLVGAEGASFVCHDKQSHALRLMEQVGHDEKPIREYAEHFVHYDDCRWRLGGLV